jgi:hypothetical protein
MLALVAACSHAVAPPTIQLDLPGLTKLSKSIVHVNDLNPSLKSRQDYSEQCAVGLLNKDKCILPKAFAYDHVNKQVTVQKRLFIVDKDGVAQGPGGLGLEIKNGKVAWGTRSTYLFKFDAKDDAGNNANQVVFSLVLEDHVAPIITPCMKDKTVIEGASMKSFCDDSVATDNVDGIVTKSMTYTVTSPSGGILCNKCAIAAATKTVDSLKLGLFKIRIEASDNAGYYGAGPTWAKPQQPFTSNSAFKDVEVLVKDTTRPVLAIQGVAPTQNLQCGHMFNDAGAKVTDTYDDAVKRTIKVQTSNNVDPDTVGSYMVKYNAVDSSFNSAIAKTRFVRVADSGAPKISLVGAKHVTIYAGRAWQEHGVRTSDMCDKLKMKVTMKWSRGNPLAVCKNKVLGCLNGDTKLGKYIRTYSVTDASGNSASTTRTYTIVDDTAPILKLVGKEALFVEASHLSTWTDPGATCHDYVGGQMNAAVKITGNNVNSKIKGTYTIQYDCVDPEGNHAKPLTRKVTVRDTACPRVAVKGKSIVVTEAGFPYKDAGATATDDFDGDVSDTVTSDGDQVDTKSAFYARRSCQEIKSQCKSHNKARACTTGDYYITTFDSAKKAYRRTLVWCDMVSGDTYKFIKGGLRVAPYGSAQGSCSQYGLVMPKSFSAGAQAKFAVLKMKIPAGSSTNDYVCSTTTASVKGVVLKATTVLPKITNAEPGVFVIAYHAKDRSNNKECIAAKRTVVVKDTLPPVIVVHLTKGGVTRKVGGGADHKRSGAYKKGIGAQSNPAYRRPNNPFLYSLMAESSQTSSVNGWIIGAAASAVTGLALLTYSSKKSAVVTVPV